MTLYLKYRPQNLDELDLVSVRESLKKIVSSRSIPHAFLFSGPKGTGKTSAARIIAKIINCENKIRPCGKCSQCISIMKGNNLDVIELDAASNRGIDDVRTLRDAIKLSPSSARKKVYIIDEAHMLTTEASNALLKVLEEPPSHVVFILATTNSEKLIPTIRSRTTEILFGKATNEEIKNSLARVIKKEKMKIDTEMLDIITGRSDGSFRDAVKVLEQYSLEGKSFLKKGKGPEIDGFVELLFKKDLKGLLTSIKQFSDSGVSMEDLIKKILENLHKSLIEKGESREETIHLIELILAASKQMSDSPIEELPLEIAVIKWCAKAGDTLLEDKIEEEVVVEKVKIKGGKVDESMWKSVLTKIHPINASIEALLRASKPMNFDGKTLTLGVFYKFHKERLEDGRHRKILEDVVASVVGTVTRVVCILTEPPVKEVKTEVASETVLTESKDNDIIKAAEEIFGV